MVHQFDPETENIIAVLLKNLPSENKIYMVGGMVRDILLNQSVQDIDLSFCGPVREFAKKVADDLHATFFMLNEKYQTARIIYRSKNNKKRWIDIVATRENNIYQDLRQRDFTVNAIAIDVEERSKIIDPLQGAKDLTNKNIRLCNPKGIADDPVRILRAVRLSVQFGWRIDQETLSAIKESVERLSFVSAERKRDELFKIFDLPKPHSAIRILEHLKLLPYCFPFPDWEINEGLNESIRYSLSCLQKFVEFENLLIAGNKSEGAMDLRQGEILQHLGRFRSFFSNYLLDSLHPDRSIRSVLVFCYVLFAIFKMNIFDGKSHEISMADNSVKNFFNQTAQLLVLSSMEMKWIHNFFNGIRLFDNLVQLEDVCRPETAYLFFKESKMAGVGACLFSITNYLITDTESIEKDNWIKSLQISEYLIDAYFYHYDEWVIPQSFINGYDIMRILNIHDGQEIGLLIQQMKLETVKGTIKSRKEAINFLLKNRRN